MLDSQGDMRIFYSNGLVGSITTLALLLLFWPLISMGLDVLRGRRAKRFEE
jgi:putative tricarboxylic transport membrane protein